MFDPTREITEADLAPFITQLQSEADAEFKLNGHVAVIEADNMLSGRAQAALALGTAFGFITGRQNVGSSDSNFWKELDAARTQFEERIASGGGFRVMYIPGCFEKFVSAAYTLFEVRRKATDDSLWIERASPILAHAGFEAAARSADAMRRKKSELSTDIALGRIKADMERFASRKQ